jgi:hypothetical protein
MGARLICRWLSLSHSGPRKEGGKTVMCAWFFPPINFPMIRSIPSLKLIVRHLFSILVRY